MILSEISRREIRLSVFLRSELNLSHALVNRLKVQNGIFVNGLPTHTDYIVKPGDRVSVCVEEDLPVYPAEEGELRILYEDEAVIALDKPAGVLIHPSHNRNTGTLANYLAWYYRETGQSCAVHPVSRLDRDTYGVVLFAKNAHTHAVLCEGHAEGRIQKLYEASVWDPSIPDSGTVDAPIERVSPTGMLRAVSEAGKPARTEFETVARGKSCALLRLSPKTGRTHQLRVHMTYIGHPILGDPQYNTPESRAFSERFSLPWQQLCARALTFPHPLTGEAVTLRSEQAVFFPEDL